jgi:taurine dioxygenase
MTITPRLRPRPVSDLIGAEIDDIDLADASSRDLVAQIEQELGRYGVLIFRNQNRLTPEQHIAFSSLFGPLEIHVQRKFLLKDHAEILIVSNVVEGGEPIGLVDAGRYWHSDLSYKAEPSLGSLLHAQELPKVGGDTLFASGKAAFAALPEREASRLLGLFAEHDYKARNAEQSSATGGLRPTLDAAQAQSVPAVAHPVVRRHEVTGTPVLFVSEGFTTRILDIPEAESRALLTELFAHQTEARFQYRHVWKTGDLVFWDNRSVIHLATGVPEGARRTLYRTTIRGPRPTPYG